MSAGNPISRWLRAAVLILLACVFGWAGLHKVVHPAEFALSVFRYHLLPHEAVNMASLWIAWIELVSAVLLLFPGMRKEALCILLLLLILFSAGLAVNLARGSHMACGCFSSSATAQPVGWISLLRNLVLLAAVGYALRREPS